jgi:hypothetical protein
MTTFRATSYDGKSTVTGTVEDLWPTITSPPTRTTPYKSWESPSTPPNLHKTREVPTQSGGGGTSRRSRPLT